MHSQTIDPGSKAVEHNTNVQNTENYRLAGEQYCNTHYSEYICRDHQSPRSDS